MAKFRIRKDRGEGEPESKMLSPKEAKDIEKNKPVSKSKLQWLKLILSSQS